ncbi:hypothetical protein ACHWQZ_G010973 [Mnemiopsis leidyi]
MSPIALYVFLLTLLGLLQYAACSSCMRYGVDYYGADITNFVASTFSECENVCKAVRSCKSITYRTSDRRCFLKYRRGGDHGPTQSGGNLISSNMDCNNKVDQTCAKVGVDYGGADLGHRTAHSLSQCEQFCRDTERCQSLTFRDSDNSCWLKYRKSGARGPTHITGLVSLNMDCPTGSVRHPSCAHYNTDFGGADLTNLQTSRNNVGMCEGFCREEPACVSFTYRDSDGQCWLKNRQYGQRGPSYMVGLTSMNMNCSK